MNKKAITLIEILVAVSLGAMISVGIYKTFLSGLKVWTAYSEFQSCGDLSLFFEKVNMDLKNTILAFKEGFSGDVAGFESVCANNLDFLKEPLIRIKYSYIPDRKVVRREIYYLKEEKPIYGSTVLEDLKKIRFTYIVKNENTGKIEEHSVLENILPSYICILAETRSGEHFVKKIKVDAL